MDKLKAEKIRDKYIIMVGGAPVNESFAEKIGADYYTPDAATAAEVAKEAVLKGSAATVQGRLQKEIMSGLSG